jgi:hypothetical protein
MNFVLLVTVPVQASKQTGNHECRGDGFPEDEPQKVLVIVLSNAVVYPQAVVVHLKFRTAVTYFENTSAAGTAVVSSCGLPSFAWALLAIKAWSQVSSKRFFEVFWNVAGVC